MSSVGIHCVAGDKMPNFDRIVKEGVAFAPLPPFAPV
jgi:hypothetical protein